MGISYLEDKELESFFSQIYFPMPKKTPVFAQKKRVIVMAGPTATGKTELSLAIAKLIGGEIISADSMQVYRGMDIGTAKATPEQRREVPHHLIDICDLDNPFNVVQYYEQAQNALKEIFQRGNVPIVVGGSGFYLHVFLYGPPLGPAPDYEVRKNLEEKMSQLGPSVLYEQLQLLDPEYAKTITEKDRHKILRALEIITLSEKKVSDFPKPSQRLSPDYNFRCWFLFYPKETLYARIEKRCEEMIEKGFLQEVISLKERGLEKNLTASQAIGYRQALDFLKTPQTKQDKKYFLQEFKKASRRYAKRQFTWFHKETYFRWINLDKVDPEKLQEILLQDYEQGF